MYKVFVNECPIVLTNTLEKETDFKLFMLDTVNLEDVINRLTNKEIKAAYLYHPDRDKLLKKLQKKIPFVVAGGGLVFNDKGQMLFIHRNSKWDLPKGKVDKGESIEEAAVREVEEETGVKDVKIESLLGITYHIFQRNGKYKLKETHWYKMHTTYNGKLKPQKNEGIDKVVWLDEKEAKEALEKSYANIKTLFN